MKKYLYKEKFVYKDHVVYSTQTSGSSGWTQVLSHDEDPHHEKTDATIEVIDLQTKNQQALYMAKKLQELQDITKKWAEEDVV